MEIIKTETEETNEIYRDNGTGCANPQMTFTFNDGTIVMYCDFSYNQDETRYSLSIAKLDGSHAEALWGSAILFGDKFSDISKDNEYIEMIRKDQPIYPLYKEDWEELKKVDWR